MKLWIAYVLACFAVAMWVWQMRATTRTRILIAMVIGVLMGYYFLNQI